MHPLVRRIIHGLVEVSVVDHPLSFRIHHDEVCIGSQAEQAQGANQ